MAFSQLALRTRIDFSPRELLVISQTISREFAPRFVKDGAGVPVGVVSNTVAFSARELLAISEEISREFAPRPIGNLANLVLMPIDPRHLHAYWQLGAPSDNSAIVTPAIEQKQVIEGNLTLRIYRPVEAHPDAGTRSQSEPWFDVEVSPKQNRRVIELPIEAVLAGSRFCAAIGVRRGEDEFAALAYSNVANVPGPLVIRDNVDLPGSMVQFILPNLNASSSLVKAAPKQEL